MKKSQIKERDLSWLSFNERVLQEAADETVPVLERLRFLAIFSSNLDEFFRVRVASLRRLAKMKKKVLLATDADPIDTLHEIQRIVLDQQEKFSFIYRTRVLTQLAENKIFIIDEKQLKPEQMPHVKTYFRLHVLPYLFPVILDRGRPFPFLKDKSIYLAIKMSRADHSLKSKFALIEIPTEIVGRFYQLPKTDNNNYIMLLDDVIRNSLDEIFSIFDFDHFEAYTIKLTRDAELEIDNDIAEDLLEKIRKGLKKRGAGAPVRFIYDETMPPELLSFLIGKLNLARQSIIPGSRYHNFKDFMDFPHVGSLSLRNEPMQQLPKHIFDRSRIMFDVIRHSDQIIHHPYQSFDYVVRFLREAAVDPNVFAIKITLYRLAKHSNIVNALINAVKNGKSVLVVMELQARFDEESNIYWTNKLQDVGARVVFGLPNLKVHSKVCLIYRKENNKVVHYAHIGTGNYNGRTSKLYCDHSLFTCNHKMTTEISRVFSLISSFNPFRDNFKHLLVAPINMRQRFLKLIDDEIKNAKKKKPAYIILKMNSLVDVEMIAKLYEANNAGVQINLIIRGICCLIPGVPGMSENIKAISIVDKFLEHARIFLFAAGGEEKMFMSSADWMTRNLDHRIEIAYPVYDKEVMAELKDILEIQLSDNTKARIINSEQDNHYLRNHLKPVRAQVEIYEYLRKKYAAVAQSTLNFSLPGGQDKEYEEDKR